jgi:signal transduction histidine kinase
MAISSSLIGRAISDLWKIEFKLTEQKKELEKTNSQLIKTNSELDRFVYSLSHDISAPLKSIKGLVNLNRIENSPEHSELYLGKIDTSINRLELFIAEVLDYSRTNRKELKNEEIHLAPFVDEIIDDFKYMENIEPIKFELNLGKNEVVSDRFLLKVILGNLISNAIKYQKNNPTHKPFIKITSKEEDHMTKIQIEDNGEGIAPQSKDKIFEMFYRGSNTSTGSGLGLYILKEAIEKLKGKIEMSSELGKGSVFTISLPSTTQV